MCQHHWYVSCICIGMCYLNSHNEASPCPLSCTYSSSLSVSVSLFCPPVADPECLLILNRLPSPIQPKMTHFCNAHTAICLCQCAQRTCCVSAL